MSVEIGRVVVVIQLAETAKDFAICLQNQFQGQTQVAFLWWLAAERPKVNWEVSELQLEPVPDYAFALQMSGSGSEFANS